MPGTPPLDTGGDTSSDAVISVESSAFLLYYPPLFGGVSQGGHTRAKLMLWALQGGATLGTLSLPSTTVGLLEPLGFLMGPVL